DVPAVARMLEGVEGVARVLDEDGKREFGLDHARSGELVLVADQGAWFDYRYWLDDSNAPDFARTVDIHRKPGYDPVELFIDPEIPAAKLRIARKILARKLGFRNLLDVISLDPSIVKGTHGRIADDPKDGPVLIASHRRGATSSLAMTEFAGWLLEQQFSG
ncbi:MAG: alkaline phosphatase family protein, partial [Planctomycetota bacterium]